MNMVIVTGIVADVPTANGNIYPRQALEKAIREFNMNAKNAPIPGGILDKNHIQRVNTVTHHTNRLYFNDSGMLCAEIKVCDEGLINAINSGGSIVARPVLSVPTFALDKPVAAEQRTINTVYQVMRVQVEHVDTNGSQPSEEPNQERGADQREGGPDAGTEI